MRLHNNTYIEKMLLMGLSESEANDIYNKLVDYARTTPHPFQKIFDVAIEELKINMASMYSLKEIESLKSIMERVENPIKKNGFNGYHNTKRKDLKKSKF